MSLFRSMRLETHGVLWTPWIRAKATSTTVGNISIPTMGGQLSLHGRDSKVHVTDYDVGGFNLMYSSAEIFTWKQYPNKTLLILYGGDNEEHEFAVPSSIGSPRFEDSNATTSSNGSMTAVHWHVREAR